MKLTFRDSYLGQLRTLVGPRTLIVPGFRIIIEDADGKILFIKRSDNGKWGLPAGSPELGESMEDCICREVKEETSLSLKAFNCFGIASNPTRETHTYPNGDRVQNFSLLIYAKNWSGQPQVNDDESTEVRFFGEGELLPKEHILQHEYASVGLYLEYKKNGLFQWS